MKLGSIWPPHPAPWAATRQAWAWVLALTLVLGALRAAQMAWHWPQGLALSSADVLSALGQGLRFDAKVCAAAALLVWPLGAWGALRAQQRLGTALAWLFIGANLINLHYFGFYKTPIDPVVFGFVEDDTWAILRTIWHDFPVLGTLAVWALAWAGALALRARLLRLGAAPAATLTPPTGSTPRPWPQRLMRASVVVVALFALVLTTKGTLRAMALGRQNLSVTTSQFLNDMVPNGVIAFKYAWDVRRESQRVDDLTAGLRALGWASPQAAAQALGIAAAGDTELAAALTAGGAAALQASPSANPAAGPQATPTTPAGATGTNGINGTNGARKNLLFFLMESWSAEPFLYHDAQRFDVLGRLAPTLEAACHWRNVDSAAPGTHPALEALLFSSPITPLTLGAYERRPIPWAIARVMQRAGYRTLFATSTRAGWRELDRVLKAQGFDEVIEASHLKAAYPQTELGVWGVWDHDLFNYLAERLKREAAQPQARPLFVFVLTATNHPPYDLPASYQRVAREQRLWGGERSAETLWDNLDTWHYATDQLGALVQQVRASPLAANTVIAASGDHNVRSFGLYATPERRHLARQVPLIAWGLSGGCGTQLDAPASQRDLWPTLLPAVGVNSGYLRSGRDLRAAPPAGAALSVNYYGDARSANATWHLGDARSLVCTPPQAGAACVFDAALDAQARAQIGLLDWRVRWGVTRAAQSAP